MAIFRVRSELCLGCGLCAEVCPKAAISFRRGYAHVDEQRCNNCRHCLEVCPQCAIFEVVPASYTQLQEMVGSLRWRAQVIIDKLDSMITLRKDGSDVTDNNAE
jgi:ferredoxin